MIKFKASKYDYKLICSNRPEDCYPMLRDDKGTETLWNLCPMHGRSFIAGRRDNGRYVVTKGNGLSYSSHVFVKNSDFGDDVWGGLDEAHAVRDFNIGNEVQALGIQTCEMECVMSIDTVKTFGTRTFIPCILQYTVVCPYRISDFAFISKEELKRYLNLWARYNKNAPYYEIAANRLLSYLRTMRDNNIFHNAFNMQNVTWALELVDFEASRSESMPYNNEEYERFVDILFEGELMHAYEMIVYIAYALGECVDYYKVDNLYKEYGFSI